MNTLTFRIAAVVRTLEDGTYLAEALLFPEASCHRGSLARSRADLSRHVREIASASRPIDLHHRRLGGEPAVTGVELAVEPPSRAARVTAFSAGTATDPAPAEPPARPVEAWTQLLPLRFDAVRWRHGEFAWVAFVPALGIEVVAATPEELDKLLPQHVRFALMRSQAIGSLRRLVYLQRTAEVRLESLDVDVPVSTVKQLAVEAAKEAPQKPVIEAVGMDLTRQSLPPAWELDAVVSRLADALTGRHPRSVLLVGPSGAGKSAAVYELVRRRESMQLARTPFWATSGSRLVAGMSGFGMWQERCQRLCREASKARAVLYLGNLVELMEVGKSNHSAQGIASFLRPYLARGEVLAVTECTPEQLAAVERDDPHLAEVFHRVEVEELPAEAAKVVLLNYLLSAEPPRPGRGATNPPALDEEGLETIDRLHRRYATYSAFPARPLRFLRNLLRDRHAERHTAGEVWTPEPPPLTRRDILAAFARETGLPLFMLDESVRLDLDDTRRWFAARVIGQDDAVGLVVDLIATVKAALNRPRRPIASLLFIGPTGVGKTEMAKTLAEFFFSSRDRVVRFDMSEYATPAAVERLVGGASNPAHAAGAPGGEGLLTAKVREQPFCVVLLDEFEKAHPDLFDLMLQVLGEGRLTDAAGRVADFANAVIIMTSNLGAESFRQVPFGLTGQARDGDDRRHAAHFVEAVRGFFRPELFNRIDRVVPFEPLGEEVLLGIARRELDLVRRRDGVRLRGVDLEVSEAAVRRVARDGFDPRYGARPLKRAMERELLVPLAEGLNGYAEDARLAARVEAEDRDGGQTLRVTVRAVPGPGPATTPAGSGAAAAVRDCAALRRDLQRLQRSGVVLGLQNELYSLRRLRDRLARLWEKQARKQARAKRPDRGRGQLRPAALRYVGAEDDARLARLPRLEPVAEAIKALEADVVGLENDLLLALYGDGPGGPPAESPPSRPVDLASARRAWDGLLLSLHALRFQRPDHVVVALYGEKVEALFDLAGAYYRAATAAGHMVTVYRFTLTDEPDPDEKGEKRIARHRVEHPGPFLETPQAQPLGLAVEMAGRYVCPRLLPERGLHQFRRDDRVVAQCLVDTTDRPAADHRPRRPLDQQAAIKVAERRRLYDFDHSLAHDDALREPFRWTGRLWEQAMVRAIDASLERAVHALIEENDAKAGGEQR